MPLSDHTVNKLLSLIFQTLKGHMTPNTPLSGPVYHACTSAPRSFSAHAISSA